jgi:hypothetical protein
MQCNATDCTSTPIVSPKLSKTWLDHSKLMNIYMDVYSAVCRRIWKHRSPIRPNSKQQAKAKGSMMVPFPQRDLTGAVCMCGYDNLILTCWQCICMITCPAGLKRIFISQLPNRACSGALHMNFFFGPPIRLPYHLPLMHAICLAWD